MRFRHLFAALRHRVARSSQWTVLLGAAACAALYVNGIGAAHGAEVLIPSPAQWRYFDELNRNLSYPSSGADAWSSPGYNVATPSFGVWKTGAVPLRAGCDRRVQ